MYMLLAVLWPATALALPCDIYAAGGTPCVAAHSLTRALYDSYAGPLYRLAREPGGAQTDVFVRERGGAANASAHAAFCETATVCASSWHTPYPLPWRGPPTAQRSVPAMAAGSRTSRVAHGCEPRACWGRAHDKRGGVQLQPPPASAARAGWAARRV